MLLDMSCVGYKSVSVQANMVALLFINIKMPLFQLMSYRNKGICVASLLVLMHVWAMCLFAGAAVEYF